MSLFQLDRRREALATVEHVLERYADDQPRPAATALVIRARLLLDAGWAEGALVTYEQILERFGDDAALRDQVEEARRNARALRRRLGRGEEP